MKTLKTILAASILSGLATTAMANGNGYSFEASQLAPTGVRAEVGTTGYGGALLWTANPYVGLALGYNGGDISWSDDLSIDGTKYDLDMDNNNVYLNAEIRPWGASEGFARSFYLAAGVAYIDNDYDVTKRLSNSNDTIRIDGKNYYAPSGSGSLDAKVDFKNQISPYVGLGLSPKIGQNFGVFGEIGAYYTGNPNANASATGLVEVGGTGTGEDAAAALERKLQQEDKFEWLPVAKVGVSFHW